MSANDELMTIVEEVAGFITEIRELNENGPHLRILHRFHTPVTDRAPGEAIVSVCLVHRRREYQLRLSLALRILFDYLARDSGLAQSVAQIEAGTRVNLFYKQHATTELGLKKMTRGISRPTVKPHILRLRQAIEGACQQAAFLIYLHAVLISRETVMNEVDYQLKATFDWVHLQCRHLNCNANWMVASIGADLTPKSHRSIGSL